mgnify:CR=1 FL=1
MRNVEDKILNTNDIKSKVDSVLNRFNTVFSTWDYDSEISLFNRALDTNGIIISEDLKNVINRSLSISNKTNGHFDITVFDLMSFWGFGPKPYKKPINLDRVDSILNYTGYKFLKLDKNILTKKHPLLKIDLNSIAKGYGVDKIFNYLVGQNFKDIFVEIGGEVRAIGKNPKRSFWKIGIEDPHENAKTKKSFAGIVELNNKSMATSGNYRNFIKYKNEVLGHTINPTTGMPEVFLNYVKNFNSDLLGLFYNTDSMLTFKHRSITEQQQIQVHKSNLMGAEAIYGHLQIFRGLKHFHVDDFEIQPCQDKMSNKV